MSTTTTRRGGRGGGGRVGGRRGGGGGPRTTNPPRQQYQHQHQQNTTNPPVVVEKRKPVFVKIDQLQPETHGHNIIANVLSCDAVKASNPRGASRISECLVGDESGTILFTARNEQVDLMKPGTTVILRNAKIDMFKGSMRLAVDKWGRIEVTEPANFIVQEANNMSLIEFELVTVPVTAEE